MRRCYNLFFPGYDSVTFFVVPTGFALRRSKGRSRLRAGPASDAMRLRPPTAGLQIRLKAIKAKGGTLGIPPLLQVPTGFEPVNNGFADRPLRPLGYSTIALDVQM